MNIGFKKVINFIGILLLLLLMSGVADAYKKEGCGADCKECHKLKKKEASRLLKNFRAKVLNVDFGPIKGMWQVEVEQDGERFPVYIHYSKKYVFSGDVINIKTKKQVGKVVSYKQKPKKIDCNKIPLEDALVIGSKTAKNTAIVFTDPDCQFCRKLHREMKKVVSSRKDIAFYIKLLPIRMLHPDAYNKAKAIVCEKSLKLLDDAFAGKKIPPPKCKTKQIDENIELAKNLGISGTPTIILKDNSIALGYKDAKTLIKLIDRAK